MRVRVAGLIFILATLLTPTTKSFAETNTPVPPGVACMQQPTPRARVDCMDYFFPGFKVWLAFHVPHLTPPWPIPCLDQHESGNNYSEDTGNGHYGAGEWLLSTWRAAAIRADWADFANWMPNNVPAGVQDQVMEIWGETAGWGQWSTHWFCGV